MVRAFAAVGLDCRLCATGDDGSLAHNLDFGCYRHFGVFIGDSAGLGAGGGAVVFIGTGQDILHRYSGHAAFVAALVALLWFGVAFPLN